MDRRPLVGLLAVLVLGSAPAGGLGALTKDDARADFETLVRWVEETHPDPYGPFGGAEAFRKACRTLEAEKLSSPVTPEAFRAVLADFLARLRDGHTRLSGDGLPGDGTSLPIRLRTTAAGLLAVELPQAFQGFLGSRLQAVNGLPLEVLVRKAGELGPCENRYGALLSLERYLRSGPALRRLTGSGGPYRLGFLTPQGTLGSFELALESGPWKPAAQAPGVPGPRLPRPPGYLGFTYLDSRKTAMCFRLGAVEAQENLRYQRDRELPGWRENLAWVYSGLLGRPQPSDPEAALAGVPSLSKTFREMLETMKRDGAGLLVIDLRGNGGGWTPIVWPALYELFGDGCLKTDPGPRMEMKLSPLVLRKRNTDLAGFNGLNGTRFRLGDLVPVRDLVDWNLEPLETRRNVFVCKLMGRAWEDVGDLGGNPVYRPRKIFVLTDAGTFSAAFHFAYLLWKQGAVLVGEPPSQAPNCFMEQTGFTLPRTGIQGNISNSVQVCFPPADPRARELTPEIVPTYGDWRRFGFDEQTPLRVLLEKEGVCLP